MFIINTYLTMNINKIKLSGTTYNIQDENATKTVELTQAQYDALSVKDPNTFYVITDATGGDLSNYYTKSETSGATEISTALGNKQDTLVSGTNIKTINNTSILGSGNIDIQGGGSSYSAGTGIDITNDVISVNSGVVTTNTEQTISGKKIFKNSDKPIEFKQNDNNSKVGFSIKNTADTNNEVASFELRPNTFTIDNVQHPLMYFGHYRSTATANAGVPQTVIGFRQYDQKNAAAYHYLMPLPEKAKTPFSLRTTFKDYYAPIGFKVNTSGTMVTTDNTGVVDLSSYIGGGGKAIVGGRGITVTSGETADTVSFSLPISAGTGSGSIICGRNDNKASGSYSFAGGEASSATSFWSFAYGANCKSGYGAWAGGFQCQANGNYGFAIGERTRTSNDSECSIGHYNVTNTGSTNDLKTLFSVGNGTADNARHNAFEIRQNGDIYFNDGTNDVKLQDTITATAANTTALGGLSLVKLTQSEYDSLATKDNSTLYIVTDS